jgi:hypothetical protein
MVQCSLIFYYLIMCVQQPTPAPAVVAASVGESGLLDKDQKRDKDTRIGMDC